MTADDAERRCALLGESLWVPEKSTADMKLIIDYLVYEGQYASVQQFWIEPAINSARAVGYDGYAFLLPNTILPGICTQTAPFSTSKTANTSTTWQLSLKSNNELLTGQVSGSHSE